VRIKSLDIEDTTQWIAFDIETTGLSCVRGARIIEIGAVSIENGISGGEFHSLIDTGRPVSAGARRIHGISDEMLQNQPKPEEVYPRFREFVGNGHLVSHNAQFDMAFLRSEFGRLGLTCWYEYRCTLTMSRRLFPDLDNHKLESVYRYLIRESRDAVQSHRALDDARMVARVWGEIVKKQV
jgi:DNA polymerase-3 subunit epsilon